MSPPRFSPWLRILIFGAGAAIASAAFTAIVVIALSIATIRSGREVSVLQSGLSEYALWLNLLAYPTIWIWLVFCRRSYDQRPVRALGLRMQNMGRALFGGAVAGVVAVAWLFGLLWLCGGVQFNGIAPAVSTLSAPAIVAQLVLYLALFAVVGFMEEVIFRGYALHNFGAAIGLRAAIWLQAVLFALIHLGNVGAGGSEVALRTQWLDAMRALPSLALIGAIFALCWAKSGTLWYPIGFHMAWNFALGCVFSLPVSGLQTFRLFDVTASGNDWISGGSFGAEGSVLLWPILAALWLTLRRLPDHPQALYDLQMLTPAPQVLVVPETTPEPENESATGAESTRRSRFQTSMRAAREADENNIGEFPILGQLSSNNGETQPPITTHLPHQWTPLTPPLQGNASREAAPVESSSTEPAFSSADFQFQPLPTAPRPEIENDSRTETGPTEKIPVVVAETVPAGQKPEIETPEPETETPVAEMPAPETPVPVPRRPTPRW